MEMTVSLSILIIRILWKNGFGVDARNDFHIHGSASDLNSIVVGHASHPEKPFQN